MSEHLSKEEIKAALKEAHKEWLDAQFATIGKWAFRSLVAMAISILIYFFLTIGGWRAPVSTQNPSIKIGN